MDATSHPVSEPDLIRLSIAEGRALVVNGALDPRDWVRALIRHIRDTDSKIGAVVEVLEDEALSEAARAAERVDAVAGGDTEPEDLPPLLGVPVGLKELVAVAGTEHRAGTPFRRGVIAGADAWVTRRLRAAGAVVLATTATHEWALGTTTQNPHFGPTRNPWNRDRIPGGSSGGSGAGLAARMFPGAVGTDTGGSIRIPAALCGVVGLKPTHGRVSLGGVVPLAWSLDHAGPMARTAEDVGLLLAALTGYDPADPMSAAGPGANGWPGRPPGLEAPVTAHGGAGASDESKGPGAAEAGRPSETALSPPNLNALRIGVLGDWFWQDIDSNVAHICRQAVEQLADLGADVRPLQASRSAVNSPPRASGPSKPATWLGRDRAHRDQAVPDWATWSRASGLILLAEAAAYHADRLATAPDRFGADVRRRLQAGAALSGTDVAWAYRQRAIARRKIARLFKDVDVLVGPTTPSAAMPIEGLEGVEAARTLTSLTSPFNITGVPALSLPCGFTPDGLPVGLQLVAGHWRDELLIDVGVAYQAVTDWHLREPPV